MSGPTTGLLATAVPCACGCGEATQRSEALVRLEDRGRAHAARWDAEAVGPLRVVVAVVRGHEAPGYIAAGDEGPRPLASWAREDGTS